MKGAYSLHNLFSDSLDLSIERFEVYEIIPGDPNGAICAIIEQYVKRICVEVGDFDVRLIFFFCRVEFDHLLEGSSGFLVTYLGDRKSVFRCYAHSYVDEQCAQDDSYV